MAKIRSAPKRSLIPTDLTRIGMRLRYARHCRRLGPKMLVKYLGCSIDQLEHWEQGDVAVPYERVRQFAYYYQVPIEWLVGDVPPEPPPCRPLTEAQLIMAEVDLGPEARLQQLHRARLQYRAIPG